MRLVKRTITQWVLCVFVAGMFSVASAQEKGLMVDLGNATVQEVFNAIERQSDYRFLYGDNVKKYGKKISIHESNATIEKVLNDISRQSDLSFKKINKNIAVTLSQPQDAPKEKKVSGTVKSIRDNSLVAGATLYVTSLSLGTSTNEEGEFTLSAPLPAAVKISALGFDDTTIIIDRDKDIWLKPNASNLGEVVVIGYGTQSSAKISGSVAKITGDKLENMPITSFEQGLAGQLPGVEIVQNSGAPGSDVQVRIRGISTITAGSRPLIVLDGLPLADNNTSNLNHADIASIEVLKDASAAAIYGSRGSNGVIIITTKKGNLGKPVFNFETYAGVQQVSHKIDMMDAYELAELIGAARNNSWLDRNVQTNKITDPNNIRNDNKYNIPPFIFPYLEGQKGLTNTDWQDEIFRTAAQQSYHLSLSGAERKIKYYISGNYLKQDGIVINSGMERYTGRINLEAEPTSRLTVGLNVAPSFTRYKLISEKTYKDDGIVLSALMALPFFSPYDADGNLKISEHINAGDYSTVWVENPVALARLIDNTHERFKFFGNSFAAYNFTSNLQYKLQVSAEWNTYNEDYFRPSTLGTYRSAAPTIATGKYYTGEIFNWIAENTLNYKRTFSNTHTVDALLGYTAQMQTFEHSYIAATNFPNNNVHTLNAGLVNEGNTTRSSYSIISMLGRVNYDYKAKYIASLALRRDGSSRFGANNKWGWFPAVSAAWRISSEPFFPQHIALNELKVKASYGRTGNNQIPDFGAVALMEPANYVLGGGVQTGLAAVTAPNANLSWEKTDMMNTGVELGLFNSSVTVTAEYFRSMTKDLLLNVPVPASSGYEISLQNIGKVKNEGYEITLGANLMSRKFKWHSLFSFYSFRNTVLELSNGQERILGDYHVTEIGSPIGSYYGYNVIGVYKNSEELDKYPHLPTSAAGSYIYEDINKDGQITDADRKIIGNFLPDFSIGFNNTFSYKNFDLNVLVQVVEGVEIYNLTRAFTAGVQGWSNSLQEIYDNYYRSEEQPGNGVARPLTKPTDKNYEASNMMVEDGSFIRIRNISLAYTIPKKLSRRIHLDKAKIYIAAKNPFTFTEYTGYNPEVSSWKDPMTPGVDYGAYPLEKSFVAGLNIKF